MPKRTADPGPSDKERYDSDMVKLIEKRHKIFQLSSNNEAMITFSGPKDTPYENGVWKIRVDLPSRYPFKSPSIGFANKIFHPNIDEASGSVCLDVINQSWSALFDLTNIFERFLPYLLTNPNASDPLNSDAASLYLHKPDEYNKTVREYVQRYATRDALQQLEKLADEENERKVIDDKTTLAASEFNPLIDSSLEEFEEKYGNDSLI